MGRINAVILAHGELAQGLVSALTQIAGSVEGVYALSNRGKSLATLEEEVRSLLAGLKGQGPSILFCDLRGGSCDYLSQRMLAQGWAEAIVYGVNLGLLVEFLFSRDRPFEELVTQLHEKGGQSIEVLNRPR